MSDFISVDGTFGEMDTAPEATKELIARKGYKTVEDLASAYKSAESKLSADPASLVVWDEKDLSPIHKRLGRPDTAAEYSLDFKSDLIDDALLNRFREHSHKLGKTQNQFNEDVKLQIAIATEIQEAQNKETGDAQRESEKVHKETVEKLKEKHGIKTDEDFETLRLKAEEFTKAVGLFDYSEAKKLGNDMEFIDKMIEFSQKADLNVLVPQVKTGVQAKGEARLAEIEKDPAFLNRTDPKHKELMKEFNEILGIG